MLSWSRMLSAAVLVACTTAPVIARAAKPSGDVLIGYVNVQRAILEVEEGKRAQSKLKGDFDKKQKALTQKEEELKKLKEAIDAQSVVTDDKAKQAQKDDFQRKLLQLQEIYVREQKELQEAQAKSILDITDKMRKVIAEIGEQGGYTLILEGTESRLLFARPHLDLTNEVIRKYNARHK